MPSLLFRNGAALVFASLMGCQVAVDDPQDDYYPDDRGPSRGSAAVGRADAALSVEWTIEGSTDPRACYDYAVDHAYITIEDDGGLVDEAEVDCEAFAYDAPTLPPGTYWASVVLRDLDGYDLTDVAESDDYDLPPGASDYVSVDFSGGAFL
jgi:hypothetical protein